MAVVPLFACALYLLLPGITDFAWLWFMATGGALFWSFVGALWLFKMADQARWAGLKGEQRGWVLASQCMGERFLALIRAGNPPDLAWAGACELLRKEAPLLASAWGLSVWGEGSAMPTSSLVLKSLVDCADGMRKAVQVGLMEGRGCSDRIEAVLMTFSQELQAHVTRELSLLATRALKPLFIFVAPSLMGLLAFGLWLCWEAASNGSSFK
jgi:hypothetical protein